MPPTKLLVGHCKKKKKKGSYFSFYQTLSTYKDCFPPILHTPLQCTDPAIQANSKYEGGKKQFRLLFSLAFLIQSFS